jgi:hypothetical protein
MTENLSQEEKQLQRKFAVDLFNYVWVLLEKPNRSKEENDAMLHAAHASRYHWEQVGTPANLARGEWQVSRVYSILNRSEPALYHARRCLEICKENRIGDFDLAYAYEAIARALVVAGKQSESLRFLASASAAGERIAEQDDRELFFSDLATIPGYSPG